MTVTAPRRGPRAPRFAEPVRTSPAAKIPGRLASSSSGRHLSVDDAMPVTRKPLDLAVVAPNRYDQGCILGPKPPRRSTLMRTISRFSPG